VVYEGVGALTGTTLGSGGVSLVMVGDASGRKPGDTSTVVGLM
jgi:hypothetical protein